LILVYVYASIKVYRHGSNTDHTIQANGERRMAKKPGLGAKFAMESPAAKFIEGGKDTAPASVPDAAPKESKTKSVGKKYITYYLPPKLIKGVKQEALDRDVHPSTVVEEIFLNRYGS
jgi:hypothetical protein